MWPWRVARLRGEILALRVGTRSLLSIRHELGPNRCGRVLLTSVPKSLQGV